MQSYFLTPLEHSLVVALALECEPWRKKDYKPVQLSDKQAAYVAARLGPFMARLTQKLLGPPPEEPAPRRRLPALMNRENDNFSQPSHRNLHKGRKEKWLAWLFNFVTRQR